MTERLHAVAAPGIPLRLRQGLLALRPAIPAERDDLLGRWLSPAQAGAFRRLPAYDQAHLCRVAVILLGRGVDDPDLLAAALLHDIAKSGTPEYPGRVRLADRTAKVLLERIAPRRLERLARLPAPRWRRGLALAVHHAALGADYAASLGCSERMVWLIAHHDADPLPDDSCLDLLARADHLAG